MNIFVTTFESVIVLLGIGLIGFIIIKKQVIPGQLIGFLSPLALEIALPSLIFVNIVQDFSPADMPDWWQLPLWWFLFTIIAFSLTFLFMFISKKEKRREFGASLFYQNAIFFPLAIFAGIFGDNSSYITSLFIFSLLYPAFFFSTNHLFFKNKAIKKIELKKIFHPVLIATIIAVFIKLGNFQYIIPDFIIRILAILGGMSIPLIMIILGGNIYNDYANKGKIELFEIIKFVSVKNIVFPLIFLGILYLLKPTYYIALIILLQSAVPPVTAVPLITERLGGDRSIVNQFIVGSFVFSLVSIPIMIYLFDLIFIS